MAKLVDQYGNPIELSRLKEEEAGPTVAGVRQVISGHPAQGLTPARLARLLRDAEEGDPTAYFELAEEMEEKDLHYRSVLSTRKNQVAGLEITVEAASDKAEDVADADLIRAWLQRDELQDELFDILDAIGKAVSFTEIVWDTSERQWQPARLEWRDPRWFEFDPADGRTPLLRSTEGPRPLTPYKYIRHVHKSKSGLPIRGGLARPVAWAYLFKNFDIKSWVVFAETYGHPLRIGKWGQGASEADKAALLSAVRNIAQDAAAIVPSSMAIEFIEAKMTGNVDLFEKMADWFDRQVSKAVLGQTGTTDVGQHVGTADAHEHVRADIEASDCVQLSATLNRDLVRPFVDLNRGPRRAYPRLKVFRPDPEDLDALVERVTKLVPLGLRVERSWMADKIGVPDPDEGAELLGPASHGGEEVPPPAPAAETAANFALPGQRDEVDELADRLQGATGGAMDAMIDAIRRLVDEAADLQEVADRLLDLYPDLDGAGLAEALGAAMTLAELQGRAEIADGV